MSLPPIDLGQNGTAEMPDGYLGMVVEGSLTNGVEVRLSGGSSVEQVKVGTFVSIQGAKHRFFGVVTDVGLGSTDPRLKYTPLADDDPFVTSVLQGTVAFGTISVLPQLTMPAVLGDGETPRRPRPSRPTSPRPSPPPNGMWSWSSEARRAAISGSGIPWTWRPGCVLT